MKSKATKREEAKLRGELSSKLTPQERIAKLDKTFGVGKGCAKERAKIAKKAVQVETKEAQKAKVEAKQEAKAKK